jgi:hypothetical protein
VLTIAVAGSGDRAQVMAEAERLELAPGLAVGEAGDVGRRPPELSSMA